jgi:very-short-patch-repair endonuclease
MNRNRKSEAQILLGIHLKELGFKIIKYEFQFCSDRKWAADIYLPEMQWLIECDGGLHSGGHKRGKALADDYEKQNTAQVLGYRFFRFSNEQVETGWAKEWLSRWCGTRKFIHVAYGIQVKLTPPCMVEE